MTAARSDRHGRALAPLAALVGLLLAASCRVDGAVVISDAHLRPTLAGGNSAAYFTVANGERDTVVVDSVTTGVTAVAELHRTTIDSAGVASMRPVGALVLPPDSTVTMQPGGLHLMMLQVSRPLRAGERVPLTLWLRDGRRVEGSAEVRVP